MLVVEEQCKVDLSIGIYTLPIIQLQVVVPSLQRYPNVFSFMVDWVWPISQQCMSIIILKSICKCGNLKDWRCCCRLGTSAPIYALGSCPGVEPIRFMGCWYTQLQQCSKLHLESLVLWYESLSNLSLSIGYLWTLTTTFLMFHPWTYLMTNLVFFDAVSKGCNLSCSDPDSGPCVSQETCRCIRETNQETCKIGQLPVTALL